MKLLYNLGLSLVLLAVATSGLQAAKRQEFTKTIKKEFDITADGTTHISNKYGRVDVKTWDRSRVKIEVTIVVRSNSESNAQKVFDRINIEFNNSSNYVKAETSIEPRKKDWWDWGNDKSDYAINYTVLVPETNQLEVFNKYGDVYIAEMQGRTNIGVKYGNFKLDGLNEASSIDLAYGKGTVIKAQDANVLVRYARLAIEEAQNLEVKSKYSKLAFNSANEIRAMSKYDTYDIDRVKDFKNSGKYDNIEIKQAENVTVNSKYSDIMINNVNASLDFDLEYGGAQIGKIAKNFSVVNIVGRYTDFKLQLEAGTNCRFDASADYAGIRYPSALNVTYEKDKGTFHEVQGYIGSENGQQLIKARIVYGGLKVIQVRD